MSGVCDCAGLLVVKPFQREDVAYRPAVRRQHPGIGPVSQLDTQPVVSPVNASRRTSRFAAHHSGPGRLAIPYPVKDFHLLSSRQLAWRTRLRVRGCRGCHCPALTAPHSIPDQANWRCVNLTQIVCLLTSMMSGSMRCSISGSGRQRRHRFAQEELALRPLIARMAESEERWNCAGDRSPQMSATVLYCRLAAIPK